MFALYQLCLSDAQILVFLEVEVLWRQIRKFVVVVAAHHQKWWLSRTVVNGFAHVQRNPFSASG